jgi:hypothetical protein
LFAALGTEHGTPPDVLYFATANKIICR